ncbi:unnamed protein product, partial [Mesorhabditis spiculigera]
MRCTRPLRKPLVNYLKELHRRNLISASFPGGILDEKYTTVLGNLPPVLYAGFDPTADSLHIGNLLVLNNLLRAAQFGCTVKVLVGGATAAVGDPSGRTSERTEMAKERIRSHANSIIGLLDGICSNFAESQPGSSRIEILDNAQWFGQMNAIDYLRVCREFRVGAMLRTGAVKARMEGDVDNDGISFTEFSYQTLQAIDWLQLVERYKCHFQIGGSDQLGHLDLGAHFVKKRTGRFTGGITMPLVTDAAGNKLGKSTGASVWLSDKRTSAFHFYQFWRQLPDNDVERLFPMFTLKNYDELVAILDEHRGKLGQWHAQSRLAQEMTTLVHGNAGLEKAEACSRALYQGDINTLETLSRDDILRLFGTTTRLNRDSVGSFAELAFKTRTDNKPAHNLMKTGAFKVNGVRKTEPEEKIKFETILLKGTDDLTLICWGKRKFQIVQWE